MRKVTIHELQSGFNVVVEPDLEAYERECAAIREAADPGAVPRGWGVPAQPAPPRAPAPVYYPPRPETLVYGFTTAAEATDFALNVLVPPQGIEQKDK